MPIIIALTTTTAAFMVLVLAMLARIRNQPVITGLSSLVGESTEITHLYKGEPMVLLQGESWQVQCETELQTQDKVIVKQANGIVLMVDKVQGNRI